VSLRADVCTAIAMFQQRPSFAQKLMERQYLEGKVVRIPTEEPLTPEALEEIEEYSKWFTEGEI
jgi:hypothetical protein